MLAEPGDLRMGQLVNQHQAQAVYTWLSEDRDSQGLATDVAARLQGADPLAALARGQKLGARYVVPSDAEWPTRLNDLLHAGQVQHRGGVPLGLWVRGPLDLAELRESVAIVGSRSATTYGTALAGEIANGVASQGQIVVSGGAFGVDIFAHRGALSASVPTVAVLAGGVDRPYPAAHREVLDFIAQNGALISEAPLGASHTKFRFLARNRLIAALTVGTLVVEAAFRSGALNTANWANRLGRVVLGVPGPVNSATSAGVHELIRCGGAQLVTSAPQVLEAIGKVGQHLLEEPTKTMSARDQLPARHRQVLDAVPVVRPAVSTSIAKTAGVGIAEVATILTDLDRAGFVQYLPEGWRLGTD
jgi:DNA processing protein